jgi:hypothetical protein
MSLVLPTSIDELETLAGELSDLIDSIAAGAVDGGPTLERLLVDALDDVELGLVAARARVPLLPT